LSQARQLVRIRAFAQACWHNAMPEGRFHFIAPAKTKGKLSFKTGDDSISLER